MFDELTTGLSFEDTRALLVVLQRLVDAGNTVIVIEHHIDVMKNADHVIDLGPLGGDRGGEVIAQGTPEEVALVDHSFTGQYLRKVLPAERLGEVVPASLKKRASGASRNGAKSAAPATNGTKRVANNGPPAAS